MIFILKLTLNMELIDTPNPNAKKIIPNENLLTKLNLDNFRIFVSEKLTTKILFALISDVVLSLKVLLLTKTITEIKIIIVSIKAIVVEIIFFKNEIICLQKYTKH